MNDEGVSDANFILLGGDIDELVHSALQNCQSGFEFIRVPTPDSDINAIDFWDPIRTGDCIPDINRGERYAADVLMYARTFRNPALIAHVIMCMICKGEFGFVEMGFLARLATASFAGSHH